MKRIGLLVVCLAFLFAASGCGEKKLVCTTKEDEGTKLSYTLKFDKNDKLKSGVMTMDMDTTDYEGDIDDAIEEMQKSYKEAGLDVKVKKSKNSVKVTIPFDLDDADALGFSNEDTSYDAILKEAEESDNMTCKK